MSYLVSQPIAVDRLMHRALSTAARTPGAIVTFLGVVRADDYCGETVEALLYEGYVPMAEREIDCLVRAVNERWPQVMVGVQHRLGRVVVGEISVAVVIAAPHRADAYAASRAVIEGIKHEVPIWKQEQFDSGHVRWVNCDHQEAVDVTV